MGLRTDLSSWTQGEYNWNAYTDLSRREEIQTAAIQLEWKSLSLPIPSLSEGFYRSLMSATSGKWVQPRLL